jgi:hypothetical protein
LVGIGARRGLSRALLIGLARAGIGRLILAGAACADLICLRAPSFLADARPIAPFLALRRRLTIVLGGRGWFLLVRLVIAARPILRWFIAGFLLLGRIRCALAALRPLALSGDSLRIIRLTRPRGLIARLGILCLIGPLSWVVRAGVTRVARTCGRTRFIALRLLTIARVGLGLILLLCGTLLIGTLRWITCARIGSLFFAFTAALWLLRTAVLLLRLLLLLEMLVNPFHGGCVVAAVGGNRLRLSRLARRVPLATLRLGLWASFRRSVV